MTKTIKVYTDGACSKNPGPGGYAAIFRFDTKIVSVSGRSPSTTNNRMELSAVTAAYSKIIEFTTNGKDLGSKHQKLCYEIVSDSSYVVNSIKNKWVSRWHKAGWVNGKGSKVKNKDLWKKFLVLEKVVESLGVKVQISKVKGHSGDSMNELADKTAVLERLLVAEEEKLGDDWDEEWSNDYE